MIELPRLQHLCAYMCVREKRVSVQFKEQATLGNRLRASVLCPFRMTGTAHRVENMEIVSHGPYNTKFEPETLQLQVQRSIN